MRSKLPTLIATTGIVLLVLTLVLATILTQKEIRLPGLAAPPYEDKLALRGSDKYWDRSDHATSYSIPGQICNNAFGLVKDIMLSHVVTQGASFLEDSATINPSSWDFIDSPNCERFTVDLVMKGEWVPGPGKIIRLTVNANGTLWRGTHTEPVSGDKQLKIDLSAVPTFTPTPEPEGTPTPTATPTSTPTSTPTPTATPIPGTGTIQGQIRVTGRIIEGRYLKIQACNIIPPRTFDCTLGIEQLVTSEEENPTLDYRLSNIPAGGEKRGVILMPNYYNSHGSQLGPPIAHVQITAPDCPEPGTSPYECVLRLNNNETLTQHFNITIPPPSGNLLLTHTDSSVPFERGALFSGSVTHTNPNYHIRRINIIVFNEGSTRSRVSFTDYVEGESNTAEFSIPFNVAEDWFERFTNPRYSFKIEVDDITNGVIPPPLIQEYFYACGTNGCEENRLFPNDLSTAFHFAPTSTGEAIIHGTIALNQNTDRALVELYEIRGTNQRGAFIRNIPAQPTASPLEYTYQAEGLIENTLYGLRAYAYQGAISYESEGTDCRVVADDPDLCVVPAPSEQSFTIEIPSPTVPASIGGDLRVTKPASLSLSRLYVWLCDILDDGSNDCDTIYDLPPHQATGRYGFTNLETGQNYVLTARAMWIDTEGILRYKKNEPSDCTQSHGSPHDCLVTAPGIQHLNIIITEDDLVGMSAADITKDSTVDGADASFIMSAWGSRLGESQYNSAADICGPAGIGQKDGTVNAQDASCLVSFWTSSLPSP